MPPALSDRFVVLAVSVVYRGCAIPVAWTILPAGQKRAWRREWLRMLRAAAPGHPARLDRAGAGRPRLVCAAGCSGASSRLGWHPFLRINQGCKFRPARPGALRVAARAVRAGRAALARSGHGVCLAGVPAGLYTGGVVGRGPREPWFVLTDLAPDGCDAQWYGLRGWCEQGFKCLKRGGWQWQQTQMTRPGAGGAAVVGDGGRHAVDDQRGQRPGAGPGVRRSGAAGSAAACWAEAQPTRARRLRLFRLGWLWLLVQVIRGQPVPLPRRLVPEPWPDIPARLHLAAAASQTLILCLYVKTYPQKRQPAPRSPAR